MVMLLSWWWKLAVHRFREETFTKYQFRGKGGNGITSKTGGKRKLWVLSTRINIYPSLPPWELYIAIQGIRREFILPAAFAWPIGSYYEARNLCRKRAQREKGVEHNANIALAFRTKYVLTNLQETHYPFSTNFPLQHVLKIRTRELIFLFLSVIIAPFTAPRQT